MAGNSHGPNKGQPDLGEARNRMLCCDHCQPDRKELTHERRARASRRQAPQGCSRYVLTDIEGLVAWSCGVNSAREGDSTEAGPTLTQAEERLREPKSIVADQGYQAEAKAETTSLGIAIDVARRKIGKLGTFTPSGTQSSKAPSAWDRSAPPLQDYQRTVKSAEAFLEIGSFTIPAQTPSESTATKSVTHPPPGSHRRDYARSPELRFAQGEGDQAAAGGSPRLSAAAEITTYCRPLTM